jgi:hypothetical protein
MAVDMGEALGRKIGPLPAWGWGVAVGGGFLVWRFISGGSTSGQEAAKSPTFVNPDPGSQAAATQGFLNDLTVWMQRLEDRLSDIRATSQPPASTNTPTSPPPATTPPPSTTQPPPASAPLSTFTQLRRDAYNYAQALYAARLGPNPGSYTTWASRLTGERSVMGDVLRNSYIYAQEQYAAGKAPNPGSYATYTSKLPEAKAGT